MAADCCHVESVQVIIISVFREIFVQEEVTVVIGILYDLSVECDLLHQRGYPKRSYLAQGKQVKFHDIIIGFLEKDFCGMSGKI